MALSEFVMVRDNVLPEHFTNKILDLYNKEPLHSTSGVAKGEIDLHMRNASELNISTHPTIKFILHNKMAQYTLDVYSEYRKMIGHNYNKHLPEINLDLSVESFRIKHYHSRQGFYGEHVDNVGQRMLAVIFYLNDVEKGGETEFPHIHHLVKPKRGRCLVFPTTWQYPHIGNIPISNDKYIIQGYLNDIRE